TAAFAAVVACAVVAGPLLFTRGLERRTRAVVLGLALVLIPLSYAPNLLTQENYATYRTVGPMAAAFALLVGLGFVAFDRGPASYSTWADAWLVWLALRQEGRTPGPGYRAVVVVGSPAGLPAGVPVVNMLGVKTAR